jgi:hypothetical protein
LLNLILFIAIFIYQARARISPRDFFRTMQPPAYSKFNVSSGFPTHDLQGEPLTKGTLKKCEKEWNKQNDAHSKWLAKQSENIF